MNHDYIHYERSTLKWLLCLRSADVTLNYYYYYATLEEHFKLFNLHALAVSHTCILILSRT